MLVIDPGRPATTTRGARGGRRANTGGQALVEFLAVSGLLVGLLLGLLFVGRLQDLQAALVQGARYAAFERALAPVASPELGPLVRARFLVRGDAPLRAGEGLDDAAEWPAVDDHWRDLRDRPLVERPRDVTLSLATSAPTGAASAAMLAAIRGVDAVATATGRGHDLDTRGWHSLVLRADLGSARSWPAPLDALDLVLEARAAVLGDAWNAAGPGHVVERTAAFVPGERLASFRPALAAFAVPLRLFEPAFDDLCLGRIDPELVPVDRLGAPSSGERGDWRAPC